MPAEPMVGLHISAAGSLDLSFDRAREVGATTFQIFTRNPNRWRFEPIPKETVQLFMAKRKASGIRRIVDHMPYLPNLASPEKGIMKLSRTTLNAEVKRCDSLGVDYLVLHLGSHLGAGVAVGVRNIAEAVNEALAGSGGDTVLLLENTAGAKNSVGSRFEELRMILDRIKKSERAGVCFDTCLPPGSPVMRGGIPVPIETIKVGDVVAGTGGWLTRVTRIVRRPYIGGIVMVKPKGLPWIHLTPEHPLLYTKVNRIKSLDESPWRVKMMDDPQWVDADHVTTGNYLIMPLLKDSGATNIDFREYIGNHTRRLPFPYSVPLSEELAELLGFYLAEGFVYLGKGEGIRGGDNSKIYLSFGKHERQLILRTIELFEKVFSLKAWTDERETATCVAVASNVLARFLRSSFGESARKKRIPPFMMGAPTSVIHAFLLAYLKGDGSVDESGVRFITGSTSVAIQLIHLLGRIDVHAVHQWHEPTTGEINGRTIVGNGWHEVHVSRSEARKLGFEYHGRSLPPRTILRTGDDYLVPIGAIARSYYEGEVFNLTTESGSFLAPFVATHNCHGYAAGFDLGSDGAVKQSMDLFEECVGWERLKVVHLNDSKGPLGGRLDRHEFVCEGKIGRKGMKAFLHYPGMTDLPLIMETPFEDEEGMRKSLKVVRSLLS